MTPSTFWNQVFDKMTKKTKQNKTKPKKKKKKTHSKWVQEVCFLVMIYQHNSKLGG